MNRVLNIEPLDQDKIIKYRDKTSPTWFSEITVWQIRTSARNGFTAVMERTPEASERKNKRIKPSSFNDTIKLKRYIWTIYSCGMDKNFSILDISNWWIKIQTDEDLNVWEKVSLSFILNKQYNFSWEVVYKEWDSYWVKFIINEDIISHKKWRDDLSSLFNKVENECNNFDTEILDSTSDVTYIKVNSNWVRERIKNFFRKKF